jgi:hypothetical protein
MKIKIQTDSKHLEAGVTDFIFATSKRGFSVTCSPYLSLTYKTPDTYIDQELALSLKMKFSKINAEKFRYAGKPLVNTGCVNLPVQCVVRGKPYGTLRFHAIVVRDLKAEFGVDCIASRHLYDRLMNPTMEYSKLMSPDTPPNQHHYTPASEVECSTVPVPSPVQDEPPTDDQVQPPDDQVEPPPEDQVEHPPEDQVEHPLDDQGEPLTGVQLAKMLNDYKEEEHKQVSNYDWSVHGPPDDDLDEEDEEDKLAVPCDHDDEEDEGEEPSGNLARLHSLPTGHPSTESCRWCPDSPHLRHPPPFDDQDQYQANFDPVIAKSVGCHVAWAYTKLPKRRRKFVKRRDDVDDANPQPSSALPSSQSSPVTSPVPDETELAPVSSCPVCHKPTDACGSIIHDKQCFLQTWFCEGCMEPHQGACPEDSEEPMEDEEGD